MGKPHNTIVLKEFDRIVSFSAYKTISRGLKDKVFPLDDEDFIALRDYLFSSVKDEGKQLFNVVGFRSSRNLDGEIQLKNYVGMIELSNGTRIEILPKIYNGTSELDVNELKSLLLSMLSNLKDFPKVVNLGGANIGTQRMTLFEIFIQVYLKRTLDLIRRGLKRDYEEIEANGGAIRGRIDIPQQIKKNLLHNERFYVKRDEYVLSRPDNRIIKSTLLKLFRISESETNCFLAKQCLLHFADVEESLDFESDYRRIVFDNSNSEYWPLIQWSLVFLRGKSFSIFAGDNRNQALLFPMDRIYEQYVASQFSRYIKLINYAEGTNYRVFTQLQTHYLFDIPPKSFRLKPDLVIKDEKPIILDTKWKIISNKNHISEDDMYQMYAYSKRHQAAHVYLLYPDHPSSALVKNKKFETTGDSFNTVVDIKFINLFELNRRLGGKTSSILCEDNGFYCMIKDMLAYCPNNQLVAITGN